MYTSAVSSLTKLLAIEQFFYLKYLNYTVVTSRNKSTSFPIFFSENSNNFQTNTTIKTACLLELTLQAKIFSNLNPNKN